MPSCLVDQNSRLAVWRGVSRATAASYVQSERAFILLSHQAKNLLKLTSGTMDYLDSDRLKRVEEWLRVRGAN